MMPYIPEDASEEEKRIHAFFDLNKINQINISEYLKDLNKVKDSHQLKIEFKRQGSIQSNLLQKR